MKVQLKDFPDYSVDESGQVYKGERVLRQNENRQGYMTVYIGQRNQLVHRLVAGAFKPCDNPEFMVVDHLNSKKWDNRPENLEWVTAGENALRWLNRDNRIVVTHAYNLDGEYVDTFTSMLSASRHLGVDYDAIRKCLNGEFKQTGGFQFSKKREVKMGKLTLRADGLGVERKKLTLDDYNAAYSEIVAEGGYPSQGKIAERLGVTRQTIWRLKNA